MMLKKLQSSALELIKLIIERQAYALQIPDEDNLDSYEVNEFSLAIRIAGILDYY
jgi:hypothetical protein